MVASGRSAPDAPSPQLGPGQLQSKIFRFSKCGALIKIDNLGHLLYSTTRSRRAPFRHRHYISRNGELVEAVHSETDLDHLSIHDCLDDPHGADGDEEEEETVAVRQSAIAARAASTISYLDPNGDHLLSPETLLLQIEADVARRDPNFSREPSLTQLEEPIRPARANFPYSLRDATLPVTSLHRSTIAGFVPSTAPRVRSRDSSRDKSDEELEEREHLARSRRISAARSNAEIHFDPPIQDPETMAILNDMQQRREETDRTSGLLGARLLQGWIMLNETCPKTGCVGIPLMKNRDPARPIALCVHCNAEFPISADGTLQTASATAPSAPAEQPVVLVSSPSSPVASRGMTIIGDVPRGTMHTAPLNAGHAEPTPRRAMRSPPTATLSAPPTAPPVAPLPVAAAAPPAAAPTATVSSPAAPSTTGASPLQSVRSSLEAKITETTQYLANLHPPHQLEELTKTAAALNALLQAYRQI